MALLPADSENTKSSLLTKKKKKYGNALLVQFSPDYTGLKCHFGQNYRYEIHTGLSFISFQLI